MRITILPVLTSCVCVLFLCVLLCVFLFSYSRVISREGHYTGESPDHPESSVGVDLKLNPSSGKSELAVGLKHQRHTFSYHAAINTEPRVELAIDMDTIAAAPLRMGFAASMPYGKADEPATFAVSLTMQL